MILIAVFIFSFMLSIPRTGGGDPSFIWSVSLTDKYSPHRRGVILIKKSIFFACESIPRTGGGDPISYGKIEPKSRYSPRMQGVYAMYSTFGDQKS